MSQFGFFDLSALYTSLDGDTLVRFDELISCEDFRGDLEAEWRKPRGKPASFQGRPQSFGPLTRTGRAFGAHCSSLLLASLYNLSDDAVEYQLRDRLSFMRFLRLGLSDKVPDAKIVWMRATGVGGRLHRRSCHTLFAAAYVPPSGRGGEGVGFWSAPRARRALPKAVGRDPSLVLSSVSVPTRDAESRKALYRVVSSPKGGSDGTTRNKAYISGGKRTDPLFVN